MRGQVQLGAICWFMSAEFFLAQFIAHLAWPAHNLFLYDISLLGISECGIFHVATSGSDELVCSPLHPLFNTGIVLHGALVVAGVWFTRDVWSTSFASSLGLLLLALGGMGAMTVGAYPLDDNMTLHVLGAVTAIAAPGLGFLFIAKAHWARSPALARWTCLVGVLVLLAGLGHALGGMPFGRGTMERLAVWPQTLWFAAVGATILLDQRSGRTALEPRLLPVRTSARRSAALTRRHV